ncbi:MAG: DUF4169 family protein [Pseudomonadota bacterium]
MSTPINLNKARKAKARADKRARADANAVAHGLTKAQKAASQSELSRLARTLDGAALETPSNGAKPGAKKT